MHDTRTNYDKIVEAFFENELDGQGNFSFYPNPPNMSGKQGIALSLCAGAMGIDSENNFLYKLRTDYAEDFPRSISCATTLHVQKEQETHRGHILPALRPIHAQEELCQDLCWSGNKSDRAYLDAVHQQAERQADQQYKARPGFLTAKRVGLTKYLSQKIK